LVTQFEKEGSVVWNGVLRFCMKREGGEGNDGSFNEYLDKEGGGKASKPSHLLLKPEGKS